MEERQKKMAAALAAVNAYTQQEAALAAQTPVPVPRAVQQVEGGWVVSGRLEMMTMRRLIQMRAFGKVR